MRRKTQRARDGAEGGVTITELLVVVAIIGLFVLVTIPAMGNYIRAARVRASNDGLVADLRAIRYIAITNRTASSLSLNQTARTWSYTDIHGATVTRTLEPGVTMPSLKAPPSGSSLTTLTVTFKPDGSLSTPEAEIKIQGTAAQGVTHTWTISVSLTGRVSSVFTRS
jgi:Tfp pilus assembly protein FimT